MASASQATLATENQAAKARIKLINAETNVHIGYVLGMLPQFMCAPKDTTHALVVRMPTVGEKNHMFIVVRSHVLGSVHSAFSVPSSEQRSNPSNEAIYDGRGLPDRRGHAFRYRYLHSSFVLFVSRLALTSWKPD